MSDFGKNAWTLMTAMPPTKGHIGLIEWASSLPDVRETHVVVTTQPGEPFIQERFSAVWMAGKSMPGRRVHVHHLNRELPQDPESEGFWDMWWHMMSTGDDGRWFIEFDEGDYFVSSETYGAKLASGIGGIYMPYDPGRELIDTRATLIRNNPLGHFDEIAREFQHNLKTTVTIFGAESTGKTTLSKEVSALLDTHWLYEWARPYLETVGPEITVKAMEDIWHGQFATQMHGYDFYDKTVMIQDTDLFSTVGYWEQPHWTDKLGEVPPGLIKDAQALKSDLYLITRANIPFEQDDIRYGDGVRESPDAFWIGVAERYGLNYKVLNESDFHLRNAEAMQHIRDFSKNKVKAMAFEREHNGPVVRENTNPQQHPLTRLV